MRITAVIIWGIVLFVFTCANNSKFWRTAQMPTFQWVSNPDFLVLLKTTFTLTTGYAIQKVGHFLGFAVFGILLYRRNNSVWKSFILSVMYAILTELLQLYFGRDGRLYDVVIDSAGIVLALSFVYIAKLMKKNFSINQ